MWGKAIFKFSTIDENGEIKEYAFITETFIQARDKFYAAYPGKDYFEFIEFNDRKEL